MADAYTTTASVGFDQAAYDRLAYFALRPELHFDQLADVKPTRQAMPGSSVIFTQITDLAVATTALNESVDVDAVAMSDANVTLTLVEYGNAMVTTLKLRATSYIPVDETVANLIGFNAGVSQDSLAVNVLKAGSNVVYATGGATDPTARNTVEPGDVISGDDIRKVVAQLRGANVATFNGFYAGVIHPDVSYDLRGQTGGTGWVDPHVYSSPEGIWNGEIGTFNGVRFMESSRAPVFADAGSSTTLTDVYATIILGRQALAKAYSTAEGLGPNPKVIFQIPLDHLKRFPSVGWYWLGAYGRFREASLRRIESSSSIGTNA